MSMSEEKETTYIHINVSNCVMFISNVNFASKSAQRGGGEVSSTFCVLI